MNNDSEYKTNIIRDNEIIEINYMENISQLNLNETQKHNPNKWKKYYNVEKSKIKHRAYYLKHRDEILKKRHLERMNGKYINKIPKLYVNDEEKTKRQVYNRTYYLKNRCVKTKKRKYIKRVNLF